MTQEQLLSSIQDFETPNKSQLLCGKCKQTFISTKNFCSHLLSCWCMCNCKKWFNSIRNCVLHMKACPKIAAIRNLWFLRGDQVVTLSEIPCPGCPYIALGEDELVRHLVISRWHEGVKGSNPDYQRK